MLEDYTGKRLPLGTMQAYDSAKWYITNHSSGPSRL